MFATDRDLLIYEPTLLNDIHWAGQQTISNDGGVMVTGGTVLTLPSGHDFAEAGVQAADTLLLNSIPVEVVSIDADNIATVSRLRDSTDDDPLGLLDGEVGVQVRGWTFRPQLAAVHEQLLNALGLVAGDGAIETPGENMVTNTRDLKRTEAIGAIHLIYTSAAALVGGDSPLWAKAQLYRERFVNERRRAVAAIDLNADGKPDAIRRASVFRFTRG
jgi:hypothetical protein